MEKLDWRFVGFVVLMMVVFCVGLYIGATQGPKAFYYDQYADLIKQFAACRTAPMVLCG
jgi:hypothetical protein